MGKVDCYFRSLALTHAFGKGIDDQSEEPDMVVILSSSEIVGMHLSWVQDRLGISLIRVFMFCSR